RAKGEFAGGRYQLVPSGGILQLVERTGGPRRRPVVLQDHRKPDRISGELFESQRLSASHGSGDGVCGPCRRGDMSVLRGNGRIAVEICVVQRKFPRKYVAGGKLETQRSGFV